MLILFLLGPIWVPLRSLTWRGWQSSERHVGGRALHYSDWHNIID